MTHFIAIKILPVTWVVMSFGSLYFSLPILRRFRQNLEGARRFREAAPGSFARVRYGVATTDFRTRIFVATIPLDFAVIGIVVLAPLPMFAVRVITTLLFFAANAAVGYKFWAEERSYRKEERSIQ